MGPISLSFDGSDTEGDMTDDELKAMVQDEKKEYKSISGMSTAEWRAKYEPSGAVDLWVEEEFNSGSRLVVRRLLSSSHCHVEHRAWVAGASQSACGGAQRHGVCSTSHAASVSVTLVSSLKVLLGPVQGGRVVHKGGKYGQGSGEGETLGFAPVHHVTIHDRRNDQVVDVDIPQDRCVAGLSVLLILNTFGPLDVLRAAMQRSVAETGARVLNGALGSRLDANFQRASVSEEQRIAAGISCGKQRTRACSCRTRAAWAAARHVR